MKFTLTSCINWLLVVLVSISILSCDKDKIDDVAEEDITTVLMSNKWCGTYDDFGTWGDDEMSLDAYDYTLFFVTNTEGFMHYVRNSADTHFGSSKESGNTKFQYSISGKDVTLYYGKSSETLSYQNFALVGNSSFYTPASISSSDRSLISEIFKNTGGTSEKEDIDYEDYINKYFKIVHYKYENYYCYVYYYSDLYNKLSGHKIQYGIEDSADGKKRSVLWDAEEDDVKDGTGTCFNIVYHTSATNGDDGNATIFQMAETNYYALLDKKASGTFSKYDEQALNACLKNMQYAENKAKKAYSGYFFIEIDSHRYYIFYFTAYTKAF